MQMSKYIYSIFGKRFINKFRRNINVFTFTDYKTYFNANKIK